MFRPSTVTAALVLAGSVGFAAEDAGCASVLATANEAGLGALTSALSASTVELAATEFGPVILGAANLEVELPEDQRVTIFAPTDVAFQEATEKFGGDLPQDVLADVLLNHVVAQELTSEAIISLLGENGGSVVVTSVLGSELFVSTDGTSIFVQSPGLEAPGATVTIPDQITCAGPVHVIDTVLLPTMPDGTVVAFADATAPVAEAPLVDEPAPAPDMMPDVAPMDAPAETPLGVADRGLPPFAFDYADEPLADDPFMAPLGEEPFIAPLGDEPVPAPLGDVFLIAPLGDEPSIAPLGDEPSIAPLGDEPSIAPFADERALGPLGDEPAVAPLDGLFADTPEDSDGGLEAGDAAGDSAPIVQGEPDSAMSSAVCFSTVAAAAAAVLMLVA